jgi:peptidoglycan/xylan/chitin deacetylase (PgdA/CDA1 family)
MNKIQKSPGLYFLTISIALLFVLGIAYHFQAEKKKLFVVFRYDDYSAISNTAFESKIFKLFSSHNMPITVGVIPISVSENAYDPQAQGLIELSPEKIELLKNHTEQGLVDVALHGFAHQVSTSQQRTEFAGVPIESQEQKLISGKKFLEKSLGTAIDIFIPPWNSYDLNTLTALSNSGFSTISASEIGDADENTPLFFIPATCAPSDVKNGVSAANKLSYDKPLMVVLFHAYDFKEIDEARGTITFQEFSEIIDWLSAQKNVNIITVDQATKLIPDLTAQRYLMAQTNPPLSAFIESTYSEEETADLFYRESTISFGTWFMVIGFYLTICLAIAGLTSLVNGYIFKNRKSVLKFFSIGSIVVTIFLIVYIFIDPFVYRKEITLLSVSLGISIGLNTLLLESRNQKSNGEIDNAR